VEAQFQSVYVAPLHHHLSVPDIVTVHADLDEVAPRREADDFIKNPPPAA